MTRRIRAYSPASIGNLAAGFDALGASVAPLDGAPWGDVVEVCESDSFSFEMVGEYAHRLPSDPGQNLVVKAIRRFEQELESPLPPLAVRLEKGLPVNSGLGSSSTSIVAALRAINGFCGDPLDTHELLALAGELEGANAGGVHLDNVAPCLLGGVRLVTAGGKVRALPWPEDLVFVLVHPDLELSTADSRAALPREVPLALAVAHAQNLASLVHALHTRDLPLLRLTLKDLLAEPFRAPLVKGFAAAQAAALAAGAVGCSLSGSGPSVFAVAEEDQAAAVSEALVGAFAQAGVPARARLCRLDLQGARLLGVNDMRVLDGVAG